MRIALLLAILLAVPALAQPAPEGDDLLELIDGTKLRGKALGTDAGRVWFRYRDAGALRRTDWFTPEQYKELVRDAFKGVDSPAPPSPSGSGSASPDPGTPPAPSGPKIHAIDARTQLLLYAPDENAKVSLAAAGGIMARRLREYGYEGIKASAVRDPDDRPAALLVAPAWSDEMLTVARRLASIAANDVVLLVQCRLTDAQREQYKSPEQGAPAGAKWFPVGDGGDYGEPSLLQLAPRGTVSRKLIPHPRAETAGNPVWREYQCLPVSMAQPRDTKAGDYMVKLVIDGQVRRWPGQTNVLGQGEGETRPAVQVLAFRGKLDSASRELAIAILHPLPFAFAK